MSKGTSLGHRTWSRIPDRTRPMSITDCHAGVVQETIETQIKPFFVCHQYKAPHDYFESHPRYDSYLADVEIPEPESLWHKSDTWGSLPHEVTRMNWFRTSELQLAGRNPRRSYAADLPKQFPNEFKWDYKDPSLTDAQVKHLAYQAYLKKYLRCVKGVDDNLKRLFDYLKEKASSTILSLSTPATRGSGSAKRTIRTNVGPTMSHSGCH